MPVGGVVALCCVVPPAGLTRDQYVRGRRIWVLVLVRMGKPAVLGWVIHNLSMAV